MTETPNPSINRYLTDKALDRIDHALGRPFDPTRESFRNYYATDTASPLAAEFDASPNWERGKTAPGGMAYFHVSDAGRAALARHLKGLPGQPRLFTIIFGGFTSSVVAMSRGKARYEKWLSIADLCPDLSFLEFCRVTRVKTGGFTHG